MKYNYIIEALELEEDNNFDISSGYLYFTKHGIGPGTLPNDVSLEKVIDMDNYMTAIYVNRPLTSDELNYYDIYPETSDKHKYYMKELEKQLNESIKLNEDIQTTRFSDYLKQINETVVSILNQTGISIIDRYAYWNQDVSNITITYELDVVITSELEETIESELSQHQFDEGANGVFYGYFNIKHNVSGDNLLINVGLDTDNDTITKFLNNVAPYRN